MNLKAKLLLAEAASLYEEAESLRDEASNLENRAARLEKEADELEKKDAEDYLKPFIESALEAPLPWSEREMLEGALEGEEIRPSKLLEIGLRYSLTIPAELYPKVGEVAA